MLVEKNIIKCIQNLGCYLFKFKNNNLYNTYNLQQL